MTAASLLATSAYALPQGGQVVGGAASITQDTSRLTVTQSSDRAVLNWHSFDIAEGEAVSFLQPSRNSVALNRVTGSQSPSQILGSLSANGTVMLVNPNGVFFGANSQVNVGSLVATTADTSNDRFMAGDARFDIPGSSNAAIVNQGLITVADAGLVSLVAPNVVNDGLIQAKLGKVQLASGDTFALDLYGDGLVSLEASDAVKSQLVSNSGIISAQGGTVTLTAAAAGEVVNSLINMDGIIQATSVGEQNGEIVIYAEGSNAVSGNDPTQKGQKSGSSTVLVSGVLDASGRKSGERGGNITVTGDNVALLNGTFIDASGHTGASGTTAGKAVSAHRDGSAGGDIRIGGDYLGQGDTPTAKNLYVDSGALILNDSLCTGDAGRIIFWSDGTTQFYGNVYARALGGLGLDTITLGALPGGNAGDGGFVETSGHQHLDAGGYVNLTASNGERGTYFLDPTDITIYGNVASVFNNSGLVTHYALDEGSGTSTADSSGNGNTGTLTNGPTWSSSLAPTPQANSYSLSFDGTNDKVVGSSTNPLTGDFSIVLWARYDSFATNNYWEHAMIAQDVGGGPNNKWMFTVTSQTAGTHFEFYNTTSGGNVELNGNTWNVTLGAWNQLGITRSGNNFTFYRNGVADGTATSSVAIPTSIAANVTLGFAEGAYFHGALDDARIYNSSLSSNDVAELYGSRFTVAGIEKMSQTANVSIQASNNITLDLAGDTLDMTAGRNLSLTAGNDILSASAGTINTSGSGSITFAATHDINLTHDVDLSAAGSGAITLRADNSILFSGSGDITTQGGAITLNADRDASGAGAISLGSGTTLASNGGNIILGGGADPNTTAAVGTASNVIGVNLNGASVSAGGGNVSIIGTGYGGNVAGRHGISASGGTISTSGNGNVTVTGMSPAVEYTSNGVNMNDAVSIANGNLIVTGTSVNAYGIVAMKSLTSTGSGNIALVGTGAVYGIDWQNYTGDKIGGASNSGNINFTTDLLRVGWGGGTLIQTSGTVTIAPLSVGTTVGVNGAAGTLQMSSAYIGGISAGTTVIGRADGTGLMRVAGADLSGYSLGNLSLLNGSGNIQFDGGTALTLASNKSFSAATTSGSFITSANGSIVTSGTGDITIDDPVTLGGNLTLTSADTITFGSTVNGGYNLTGTAGTFSFAKPIGQSTALGAVSLISANALTLPTIFASSISASTTSGNISGAGGLVTSGGNLTLSAANDLDLSSMGIITNNGNASLSSGRDTYLNTWISTGTGDLTVSATRDLFLTKNDMTSGLVSYYKFDEGSGTTASDSAGSNTGTLTNGPTWSSNTPFGTGYSLSFDGSNDYVALASMNLGIVNTTSLWVNLNCGGAGCVVLGGQGGNYAPYVDATSIYYREDGPGWASVAHGGLNNGTWYQFTIVRNGTAVTFYKDGTLLGTTALPSSNNAEILSTIGAYSNLTYFTNGKIDDVRIYNTALSATDVAKLYAPQVTWGTGTTSLSAGRNIATNLQGDTLALASGKSLTASAAGSISNTTAGTITATRSGGVGGDITMTAAGSATLNTSNLTLNANNGGSISLTSPGAMTLGTMNATSILARSTGASSDLTIPASKVLTASGSGTAITLAAGRNFVNNAGSGALSTPSGRWLVYSTNPANDTIGSLSNSFRRFTCAYGGSCPSFPGTGNGLLYSYTPTLTATPNALTAIAYGDAVPNLSGYAYTLSGYLGSDSGSDTVSGSLTGSTGYSAGSNIGSYAINYASGSLASALGYGFSYANNATAIAVGQKTLTAGLTGTVFKRYDGTTVATLTPGNYALSGVFGSDDVALNNPTTGAYDTPNTGAAKLVTVNGLALVGTAIANYSLSSATATGAVGQIGNSITASEAYRIQFSQTPQQPLITGQPEPSYKVPSTATESQADTPDTSPQDLAPALGQPTQDQPDFISVDPAAQVLFDLPPRI